MVSEESLRPPILEALIPDGVPFGTVFVVEFDPDAHWYATALTMVAGVLNQGHQANVNAFVHSASDIRTKLSKIGVDVKLVEGQGRLRIADYYTSTTGTRSSEKEIIDSMNVAEWSVDQLKVLQSGGEAVYGFGVTDNSSVLSRYNDEKSIIRYLAERNFPVARKLRFVTLFAFMRGVHSESFYKNIEGITDGVIDLKLDEKNGEMHSFLRVRSIKYLKCDTRWHRLALKENLAVTLG